MNNPTNTPSGVGYCNPPVEHRFKPGHKFAKGRPRNAGSSIRECVNALIARGMTEAQLRRVARSKRRPAQWRAAAERVLRMLEHGDVRDFEAFLNGTKTLDQLHAEGVNTEAVKSAQVYMGKDGNITSRKIELWDRSGDDSDRVVNHTDGTPRGSIDVATHEPITEVCITIQVCLRLIRLLKLKRFAVNGLC
jgi:hypothetical protein